MSWLGRHITIHIPSSLKYGKLTYDIDAYIYKLNKSIGVEIEVLRKEKKKRNELSRLIRDLIFGPIK